ncbi:DCD domain-containing protein NRP-B-like [Salvia miltiorrhiza]|uniref:DCD domain-containing protein NRP-B-like n=1 Tax=Salvia miltiorrhiza TaxID=226208 RepID=UPI0025AC7F6B|nr:DCD domain-containing protein NRP-B-like [Salvia miltiorrhiza]
MEETQQRKAEETQKRKVKAVARKRRAYSEFLPLGEALGGYIFVCNNGTILDCLRRNIFGLPDRFGESVRAIRPGTPVFLYNYSTRLLHGIFEAVSFGGMNIDPEAWPHPEIPGRSFYPAQVRVRCRMACPPLNRAVFRSLVGHSAANRYHQELSVSQALMLLETFQYLHWYCVTLAQQMATSAFYYWHV